MAMNKCILLNFAKIFIFFVVLLAFNNYVGGGIEAAPIPIQAEPEPGIEQVGKAEDDVAVLADYAVDLAQTVGLITRASEHPDKSDLAQIVPFALYPSPFPKEYFQEAVDVQTAMQLLRFRVANDYEFLAGVLRDVATTDEDARRQMEIVRTVNEEGIKQPIALLIQRTDYFLNVKKEEKNGKEEEKYELKQVEVNIGPVGGSDRARRLWEVYHGVLTLAGMDASDAVLPKHDSDKALAEALYMAWEAFDDPNAIMLFVVYHNHSLQFGGRFILYEFEQIAKKKKKVKIARLDMTQCAEKLTLDKDFSLRLDGQRVAVVYDRTIPPRAYPSEKEWAARLTIERSTAIKCPTMAGYLSGSKKIQQVLAQEGMVERFFPDPKDAPKVTAIRATFAGLWGLDNDDEETRERINDAIAHPSHYVLKPEGGGGGHNYFDEDVAEKLRTFSPEERGAHILMERLRPMVVKNYQIRPMQEIQFGEMVSELGIFGCLLGNIVDGSVMLNEHNGHYMRSKWEYITEGGIAVGGGVVDFPYLF